MQGVLGRSLNAWIDHRSGSKGAALAFYTLFAMTPILILAIAGAGYFFGADAAQGEIIAQIEGLVGRSGAQAIQAMLVGAQDPAAGLTATMVASVVLLVAATSVFVDLKGSLDELWGIEPPKGLAIVVFLRTQLHSFGLVLVLAFLLLGTLVLRGAAVLERCRGISRVYGFFSQFFPRLLRVIACLLAGSTIAAARSVSWRYVWIALRSGGIVRNGKNCDRLYLGTACGSRSAAGSLIACALGL